VGSRPDSGSSGEPFADYPYWLQLPEGKRDHTTTGVLIVPDVYEGLEQAPSWEVNSHSDSQEIHPFM